jgi:hypothetical protein
VSFPGYRNIRRPLAVEVRYLGGAVGMSELTTRGWRFQFPGHVPLLEVMLSLNGQWPLDVP